MNKLFKITAGCAFILLGLAHVPSFVFGASDISVGARVAVATTTASPSTLCSADPNVKGTILINANTDYILLGDSDTSFSKSDTTGTFRLAGTATGTTPIPFRIDVNGEPFTGGLKAVAGGSGSINIDVIRIK